MNKRLIISGVIAIVLGILMVYAPVHSGGYLAAAGFGIIIAGAVSAIAGLFTKPKQK